jgi:eukaryotic-like serine/threonine-protein kinase
MTPERRQQIEGLFEAALDQAPERRAAFLAGACGGDAELRAEAEALLAAHDRADGPLERPIASLAASLLDERVPERQIGPYQVLRELGRGGMGVVYLAERGDGQFRRRVAIKLVRSGLDDGQIQRRFLAERQILASLSHPNIAQLLDGGVTDGQLPYLVMEYVEGLPITAYCDKHRLDIEARLRLFQEVCAAVHHAHQNLVIHRDLKPSNIVVDARGRVKLLDFGIAKLLNPSLGPADAPFTRFEQWVMTPDYASPEQVRGEPLTTASDVYSLGVILYELLTGHRPYHLTTRSPDKIMELVCERDPERPSTRAGRTETITLEDGTLHKVTPALVSAARAVSVERLPRQLRGDLDAIVMMALRKEPRRRYGSAEMLSEDIHRYLDGLPVDARQGNRRYHVAKFLRRRRVEAIAAALVVLSLLIGAGVAARQAAVAVRERDRAETALAQAQEVTDFLMQLFHSGEADPGRDAGDVSARDLLRRGAARADALADQPAVQARLLDVIGRMQHNLGEFDDAQRMLERAVAVRRTLPEPASLAQSLIHLSWVYRSRTELDESRRLVEEALEIRRRVLPADHPDVAEAVYELGYVAATNEELEARYREALGLLRNTGALPERQVGLLQGLATSLRRQGRLAEAVDSDREALRLAEREFGPEHVRTGYAMIHLADQVRDIEQDFAAAERLYRRGLELLSRQPGDYYSELVHGLHGLAGLQSRLGNHAEAERLHREALRIRIAAVGERHPVIARALGAVAIDLERQGRLAEAEATARESLGTLQRILGTRHSDVGTALLRLAHILFRQGRHAEADQLYREAIELKPPHNERQSIDNAETRRAYGRFLTQQRRFADAEEQLLRSLELLETAYAAKDHPNTIETKRALMELYGAWAKPEMVERHRVPPGEYISY